MQEGKGTEKGQEMVDQLLKEYIEVEPITKLSNTELLNIKNHLKYSFNREIESYNQFYNRLINDEFILIREGSMPEVPEVLYKPSSDALINISSLRDSTYDFKPIVELLLKSGLNILTQEQKVELCKNPEFLYRVEHYFSDPKDNTQYLRPHKWVSGSRRLIGKLEGYYNSREDFISQLEEVRKLTGKSKLKILDVGSNFGFALKDMKKIDNNIETFNMTIDENPSIYGDHIVHHPAELMPKEFYESMDLIESQVAFRYFPYSDIGLQNVIKALSVGGVARIHYTPGHISHISLNENQDVDISREEIKQRDIKLRELLKTMEKENYLKLEGLDNYFMPSLYSSEDSYYLLDGFFKIIKNKSINDFDFKIFNF